MTRKELMKLIEDEIAIVAREPIREPAIERPKPIVHGPALKNEEEIDDMLFRAGQKKEK